MNTKRPTIEAFRALVRFADTGGVRATSRDMGTSQSVVTRKLNAFKKAGNCDAILLTENGQSVELTEAGQAILPAVRDLIRQYDQLLNCLSGESEAAQRVRIATGHFSAEFILPLVLDKELCQQIQTEIRVVRGRDRILGVAAGKYDLGILTHQPSEIAQILFDAGKPANAIRIESLQKRLMVVIASKRSAEGRDLESLSPEKSVPMTSLNRWDLLGLDQDSGIRRQLERQLSTTESMFFLTEGGGWSAAREFCRKGLGVAILPLATLTARDQKDFVIRRLASKVAVQESVIFRHQSISLGCQRIFNCLKSVTAKLQRDEQRRWTQFLQERA